MNRCPNQAVTSAGICGSESFYTFLLGVLRRRFQPRSRERALAYVEGRSIRAVAGIGPRSGLRSWEVSHLYADPDSDAALTELLEQVGVASARGGAERVFLRVEADSDLIPAARRAGFFPSHSETLYRGPSPVLKSERGLFDADAHSTKRGPEHDHALFRLYNQTTPLKTRQLVGMTLEQWKDSTERPFGRSVEMALELEGAVIGWFRTSAKSGGGRLEMRLRPDRIALTPDIIDHALASLADARSVAVLAPEYVPILGGALEERGFRPAGSFAVLVKSIARAERHTVAARTSLVAE